MYPKIWRLNGKQYMRELLMSLLILTVITSSGCFESQQRETPGAKISFYRLRFELSTTSESVVIIQDTSKVLTAHQISTTEFSGVTMHELWAKSAGKPINITGDYAIAPEAITEPFSCLLRNGHNGKTTLSVYNIPEKGPPELLKKIDCYQDSLSFSIDLTQLQNTPPLQKDLPVFKAKRMICACYYPWYTMKSWESGSLKGKDRPLKLYSSGDRNIIAYQIEKAKKAGIDAFLCYWKNPGSYADRNFSILLDIAQDKNFFATVKIQAVEFDQETWIPSPRDEATLLSELEYIFKNYADHPSFLKIDGKPVIITYASTRVSFFAWKRIFSRLEEEGYHGIYFADYGGGEYPQLEFLDLFDGFHLYNVLGIIHGNDETPILAEAYKTTASAVHYYPLLMDSPSPKLWAATVEPGYDDTGIPGRTSPILEREDGRFYRDTFTIAIKSDPDWIFITTWNEWWEQSHIEESVKYGDRYLQITDEFAEKWK